MLKTILFCSFLLLQNTSSAQNYEKYYLYCNDADSLTYLGLYDDALATYKKAFNTVDYIHSTKSKRAYQVAIKAKSFQDAFEFGKITIINSGDKKLIKTRSISFKRSNYYQLLKDSSDYYLATYNKRVNHDYISLIDSLMFIDQYIIRKNRTYKADFEIDKSKLPENLFELDNSNWKLLYSSIQELGFPSEENVGKSAYYKARIILHHNLRLEENEKYHKEIFEFVKTGDYLPNDIMVWYEQFQMQVNGQTFFTTWDGNTSLENLKKIDANRRRFYLKGINTYKLKKNGKIMKSLW